MGVDYYPCQTCGECFPDILPYYICASCGTDHCESCGDGHKDEYGGVEENTQDYDFYGEMGLKGCSLCKGTQISDDQIIAFLQDKGVLDEIHKEILKEREGK